MVNEERIPRTFFGFGASAGGIEALIAVLDILPSWLDATIAIVMHRSPSFQSVLVDILGRHCALPTSEPRDGEAIQRGRVYLAPRDRHLIVNGDAWHLADGEMLHRWRPAVDPLFKSAAKSRGSGVAGVLLSGGGSDGVEGLIEIKRLGGLSIAQDPRQALQESMPASAIKYDDVDAVLRVEQIGAIIPPLVAGEAVEGGGGDGRARRRGVGR